MRCRFAAKDGSLSGAWRPLFYCASTGKTLESVAEKYQDDGSTLTDRLLRVLAGDPLPTPRWLKDLDWYCKLRCNLKAAGDDPRVIILGPNTSDDVPALWFLLACLRRHDGIKTIPPMVSTAATWSALKDYEKISYDPGAAYALSPWVITLGRALGLSADEDHFRFARETDQEAMCKATERAKEIAASFIQYAKADDHLVEEIHHQLVDVRGYRRLAVLYRDSMADVQQGDDQGMGDARRDSPKLARRLYGPAISDEFERKYREASGTVYLDSPFPKAPSRSDDPKTYEKRFADWEDQTRRTLKPILRFFERERVEAVGVFGNSADEKSAVLKVVRRELPNAQLFTSEPDWQLESPDPPGGGIIPVPVGARPPGGDYPLNGLMIFAGSVPDRNWVRRRFQELNELTQLVGEDHAFLPGVFNYYTAHVVKRLVELAQGDKYELLRERRIKSAAGTGPCSLEDFLRGRSNIGDKALQKEELAASGKKGDSVLMLISNGRLHQISQPDWSPGHLGITLGLAFIVVGLIWFLRPDRRTGVARPPEALTLWAWLLHGREKSAAGDGNGQARHEQPSQGESESVDGGPPAAEEQPPPTPATRRGFLKSLLPKRRPMRVTMVGLLILLLPLVTLQLDMRHGLQVSPSLLPDAHSVLPSLVLFALVFVLALRLPDEFRLEIEGRGRLRRQGGEQEIEGRGRLRRQGGEVYEWGLTYELPEDQDEVAAEAKFDERLRVWKRDEVDANLMPDRVGWAISIGLALALTLLDCWVGLPIPKGITWFLLSIYEWITLVAVISMALIFGDMARAVHRLRSHETSDERFLRLMDPESVRRLGTAFIGVVANCLLIFTLLLVARLPWLAMPRWRWNLVLGPQNVIPLGPILFAVSLLFILGYWYYCHRTFRSLIQRIKYVKLCRLRDKRREAIAVSQLAASGGDQREEVKEQSDRFEELRQGILAIPEEPWNPVGARKAQVALSMALATPVVSMLLGPWSPFVVKAISSMFGS